ncbi:TBC1 domain family member 10A isoform X2 [Oryzias melastigma]|uniref:TBC1 domain family member 10A isoform X2 n=1 Tax=Oryzias melastigma TaxID=30732 RepID=UPI000CF7EC98|nr:TBC1 domain family member 10A isoform X2 [Oryzias melastigma]
MRRRSSSSRGSSFRRRSDSVTFDEFGFAVTKRKEQKVHHRSHDYSSPQLSRGRLQELRELLSYWNPSSFLCRSQMERFIRMGIPPSLRGRVWKSLLNIHVLRGTSCFNYQTCLSDLRQPLVDLGVSEYGILSAISTLSNTQNHLTSTPSQSDICLFRQIALDLQRSFPTHRSLMGETPEAIEGRAKLFRVLAAYAKYNPQVGYSQVLLMQLEEEEEEEEAFWALAALLDQPKYLAELFDLTLTKVQHQVKVFEQFFKHRKPQLSQHLESVGILSVHFVMPWFLTLFTSLPCWDTVLAVWDLIFLFGLPAVFRSALTIMELLEPRLLRLTDEGAVLPLLLRVPVDVAQYSTFVPALWRTEVEDWELKCLNRLVLDENHGYRADICFNFGELMTSSSSPIKEDRENLSASPGEEKAAPKDSVLTRAMRIAQRYLFDPRGQRHVKGKRSQSQAESRQLTSQPKQTSASVNQPQVKSRWHRRVKSHPAAMQRSSDDSPVTFRGAAAGGNKDRCEQALRRTHRRSNHSILRRVRTKSLDPVDLTPPASAPPAPPSVRPSGSRSGSTSSAECEDSPSAALMKELSLRHQSSIPVGNTRESQLI